jgi:hypothetical protein
MQQVRLQCELDLLIAITKSDIIQLISFNLDCLLPIRFISFGAPKLQLLIGLLTLIYLINV